VNTATEVGVPEGLPRAWGGRAELEKGSLFTRPSYGVRGDGQGYANGAGPTHILHDGKRQTGGWPTILTRPRGAGAF